MGDKIVSHPTNAPPPSAQELKPPVLVVTADTASSQASMNAITNAANDKNTMNGIAGGGITRRRGRRPQKRRLTKCKCKCKCKCKRCRASRRGRSTITSSQRRIISRRVQLNLLHRKIRKNKISNSSSTSQRGGNSDTVPQHGASCASSTEPNCPGNSSAALLDASRQASANAQGDHLL